MISLIVPTYLPENQKYLDLLFESIDNLDYPKDQLELIVVSSGGFEPKIKTSLNHKLGLSKERKHYAQAINIGVKMASPDSKFYFHLSDDVILTKNCLTEMLPNAEMNTALIAATSNCDNSRKYQLLMGLMQDDGSFLQFDRNVYEYQDLVGHKKKLMNAESIYPPGLLFENFVCFYAVLIPAKVWKVVGELDENFENGQEDLDYCLRLRAEKIPIATCLRALIWHFSGVTAKTTVDVPMRIKNIEYFQNKYQRSIKDFII